MLWYGTLWYDMCYIIYDIYYDIWYDMIRYDMIQYDMIWYMIWYDTIWYDMYDMIYDMIFLTWVEWTVIRITVSSRLDIRTGPRCSWKQQMTRLDKMKLYVICSAGRRQLSWILSWRCLVQICTGHRPSYVSNLIFFLDFHIIRRWGKPRSRKLYRIAHAHCDIA